jgi:hypothetical protein
MKSRTFVSILILVLTVLVVVGSCATKRQAVSEDEFYTYWVGTWMNTDLRGDGWEPQKIVCNTDATIDRYTRPEVRSTTCEYKFAHIDSWKDSEGNIWYRATSKCSRTKIPVQEYGKISVSNKTYELIYNMGPEPIEEWDRDNFADIHLIYYRQE